MDEWPWEQLPPQSEKWMLQGVAIGGGVSVGGVSRLSRTDGGGLWVGEQSFLLHTIDQIRVARAIEGLLDGGVSNIVAWSFEEPFAPVGASPLKVSHSDGSTFDDGSLYVGPGGGGVLAAAAILRATVLTVAMNSPLRGGEQFSIIHPVHGWRRYRVVRVDGDTVTVRPPLREAADAGTFAARRSMSASSFMIRNGSPSLL